MRNLNESLLTSSNGTNTISVSDKNGNIVTYRLDEFEPTTKELAHILDAKAVADAAPYWSRKTGINYKSISDPMKYAKYYVASKIANHQILENKLWDTINSSYYWSNLKVPDTRLLYNIIRELNRSSIDSTISSNLLAKAQKMSTKHVAKKAARAQNAAAAKTSIPTASSSSTTPVVVTPGKVRFVNYGKKFTNEDWIDIIKNAGIDIVVDDSPSNSKFRPNQSDRMGASNLHSKLNIYDIKNRTADEIERERENNRYYNTFNNRTWNDTINNLIITYDEGKPTEFSDKVSLKATNTFNIFSNDEVKGLPDRQYALYIIKKWKDKLAEVAANSSNSSDVDDDYENDDADGENSNEISIETESLHKSCRKSKNVRKLLKNGFSGMREDFDYDRANLADIYSRLAKFYIEYDWFDFSNNFSGFEAAKNSFKESDEDTILEWLNACAENLTDSNSSDLLASCEELIDDIENGALY